MSEVEGQDKNSVGEPGDIQENPDTVDSHLPENSDTKISALWGTTIDNAGDASPMTTLKVADVSTGSDDVLAQMIAGIDDKGNIEDSEGAEGVTPEKSPTAKLPGGLAPIEAGKTRLDLMITGLPSTEVHGLSEGNSPDTPTVFDKTEPEDFQTLASQSLSELNDNHPNPEFVILRHLASGGMGDVYEALQSGLDRVVAFKVPKIDPGAEQKTVGPFVQEAAVAGELEHPNIVPIYKSGTSRSGKPFYAMKRVNGIEWRFLLHPETLSVSVSDETRTQVESQAAKMKLIDHIEILIRISDAVAFAHSRWIIHRDLKPENVMVGEYGDVLLMDWGLALDVSDRKPEEIKALHVSLINAPAGTPAYMAPEMAECIPENIGMHSDIYLLGAILYEILTRTPPHWGDTLLAVIQTAFEGKIVPPEERAPDRTIPKGLADITLKAMARNPENRYESVEAFQQALRQYRTNAQSQEIAREADMGLFSLQDKSGVFDETVYTLYAEVIAAYKQAIKLWDQNRDAGRGLVKALEGFIDTALHHGDLGLAGAQIDHLKQTDGHDHETVVKFERRHAWLAAFQARRRRNFRILLSLVAIMLVTIIGGGIIFTTKLSGEKKIAEQMRDEAERAEREAVAQEAEAVKQRDIAEMGKKKIEEQQGEIIRQRDEAERAEREAVAQEAEAVKQRDIANKQKQLAEVAEDKAKNSAEHARQNLARVFIERAQTRLDDGRDYGVAALHLVEALKRHKNAAGARGLLSRVLQIAPQLSASRSFPDGAQAAALSLDGKYAAVGTNDGNLIVLRLPNLTSEGVIIPLGSKPWSVSALPDGSWLVALDSGRAVLVPGIPQKSDKPKLVAPDFEVPATNIVGWSGKNARFLKTGGKSIAVAIGYRDGQIALQSLSGDNRRVFQAHWGAITALHVTDDGHLVSASWDSRIRRWNLEKLFTAIGDETNITPAPATDMTGHSDFIYDLDVTSDGTLAISAGADQTVRLWDLKHGLELRTFTGHTSPVGGVVFLQDETDSRGKLTFASQGWDGRIRLWDARVNMITATMRVNALNRLGLFAQGGSTLLSMAEQGGLKLWNVRSKTRSKKLDLTREAPKGIYLNKKGNRVLVHTDKGELILYNESGKVVRKNIAQVEIPGILDAWFGSKSVRVVQSDGRIRTLRFDGKKIEEIRLPGQPRTVAFTPDGRYLATAYKDHLAIYDTKKRRQQKLSAGGLLKSLPSGKARAVSISLKGERVAALYGGQIIAFAGPKQTWLQDVSEGAGLQALCLSPDGKNLIVAGEDRVIRVFSTNSGRQTARLTGHEGVVTFLSITPDGQTLISGSRDSTVRFWDLSSRSNWLTLNMTGGWIRELMLSANGKRLVTLTEDGHMQIWSIPTTGEQLTGDLGRVVANQFGLSLDADGKPFTIPPGRR